MLSIFSCVCWPSGCLLWKSVYSCLLPISTGLFILGVEFGKFFIDFGQPFIGYVICKYLLPFHQLPFGFVDCFLCCAIAYYLDEVPTVHFLLLFLLPLEICQVRSFCNPGQRGCCLFSPIGSWWFPVSHLGLSSILNVFLCMVSESSPVLFLCILLSSFPNNICCCCCCCFNVYFWESQTQYK